MATYFNKYYFEFRDDIGFGVPVNWRVDIMDSEGAVPSEPTLLTMGAIPLVCERIEDEDSKQGRIIGEQATIEYMYTGAPADPLPDEFFESSERRYKVEVRKNGVLDRVFFIRPDGCGYPETFPPYTVTLTAVDGYSFAKGIRFNAFQESGLLLYDKITLYDAIMTRGLLQTLEPSTPIRVLQSLHPENMEPGTKMLFGLSIHTDIFYDFVKGAKTVHKVVSAFCKSFYARCFNSQAKAWFIRTQDLDAAAFTLDEYTDDSTVTEVAIPDMVKLVGPSEMFDGIPLEPAPLIQMQKAVKRADFEAEYKGINQLTNFDWSQFSGTDFTNWVRIMSGTPVGRGGTGTPEDPYTAQLPYEFPSAGRIIQGDIAGSITIPASVGDILDIEIPYRFTNTKDLRYVIYAVTENIPSPGNYYYLSLDPGGSWRHFPTQIDDNMIVTLSRGGRKRNGNLELRSLPLPSVSYLGDAYSTDFQLSIQFFYPNKLSDESDGPESPIVDIFPVKLGIIKVSSQGRHLTTVNEAEYSQVLDVQDFTFIDTGEDGLSNTLFTGAALEPAENWDNDKPNVSPADLERHMAEAYIDQAPRSPIGWEGTIASNEIDFHNVIEFSYRPGVRFMQIADRYTVHNGIHEIRLQEIFNEGNANIDYSEYDIEEEENE